MSAKEQKAMGPRGQQSQASCWQLFTSSLHCSGVPGDNQHQAGAAWGHTQIHKCQFSTRDICSVAAPGKPSPLREANTWQEAEMLISTKAKPNGRYLPKSLQIFINFSEMYQWHHPPCLSQAQTTESQ